MKKSFLALSFIFGLIGFLTAQADMSKPQRFDYGKMWTFENPPKDWFKEAYRQAAKFNEAFNQISEQLRY